MKNRLPDERFSKAAKVRVLVLALVAVTLITAYRGYLYALLHRGFGSDQADFIGHKVRLPFFWFKEDEMLFGDSFIGRAYPNYLAGKPVVSARSIAAAEVKGTDAEVIERRRTVLAFLAEKSNELKSSTAIDIHSKAFTLYCIRDRMGPSMAALSCRAAGLPFILNYSGPMSLEPEAEAILSSFN